MINKETSAITGRATDHPLYNTWYDMIRRCFNPTRHNYKYYGGRGVMVCQEWLNFNNFVKDMYSSYEKGLTLDRKDSDGHYTPQNCKWSTKQEQALNRRNRANQSGFKGVYKMGNKWQVQKRREGKTLYLGTFSDLNRAIEVSNAF